MNDRHPFLASFATLFLVPMTLLILIFSAFELRPPLIAIKSHLLQWVVEYKDLYVRYEHAVWSWDLVFILGFLLTLSALVIESVLRRHQGNISVGFHTAMAFLVALCSFWAVGDFHFRRYAHIAVSRSPENWLASKYAVIVIYSSLKNATLYAAVCWIVCRFTRKMNHCTQHGTTEPPFAFGSGGRRPLTLAEWMKTKRKRIVATAVILLLPILFVIVMHREVAGSIIIFTARTTPLRIYYSSSGNLSFAVRSEKERLRDCDWIVTRKNKVAWSLVNVGAVYLAFPYFVADALDSNG